MNGKTGERVKVSLPQFKFATADDFFETLDHSTSALPITHGERPNVWLYIHGPSHEKALTASREEMFGYLQRRKYLLLVPWFANRLRCILLMI